MIIALILMVCTVYLGNYYRADNGAIETFAPINEVRHKTLNDNTTVFLPEKASAGLIFYPGGKVEHTAYIPLMEACASEGILCILVEMPFRLAVFDIKAADGIREQYPEIKDWYIGGHSPGGSMAASYLKENATHFEGWSFWDPIPQQSFLKPRSKSFPYTEVKTKS